MPFNSIFAWVMKKRIHQIDLFRQFPFEVQLDVFNELISSSENTEFGKRFNFVSIKHYEDFKRNVPLQDYETLKGYIFRLIEGEEQLLWGKETKWFAKSSGTSSDKSKLIPITKDSLVDCHYKGGKDLLALYYSNLPERKLYNGKHLIVGGSAQINPIDIDSYFGDLSAIIIKNLPWWAEIRRTPSMEIALLSDWEEKLEKMAKETIDQDIYIVAGVPSWTYLLLKKVLEITKKKRIDEVWPNIELFMHGGVSFEPYKENFKAIMPPNLNYVETYNASEGFFGIQDNLNDESLLLMLDYGIFYEFIPMSDFDGLNSKNVIALKNVELGINYALVISTNGGLWRYIIGDTIMFTSKTPYKFKITGRTASYINLFGEEVIVSNTDRALAFVCEKYGLNVVEYTVAPMFDENKETAHYFWAIEFENFDYNQEEFEKELDDELKKLNSDYEAKRQHNLLLKPIKTKILERGSFESWFKMKNKLGGQHKIPRLSQDLNLINELISQ